MCSTVPYHDIKHYPLIRYSTTYTIVMLHESLFPLGVQLNSVFGLNINLCKMQWFSQVAGKHN